MSKIKIATLVFVLVSVLDIIGIVFRIPSLIFIFKPLILLSLLILFGISSSKKNKWYVLALIFSFFGDVFLMFDGELFFIVGLISFLLAHFVFIKIVLKRLQKTALSKVILAIIPFIGIFSGLIFTLRNSLGEMLLPVIVYGLTISIFGAVSFMYYLNTKTLKAFFMILGAFVFIISDSVLAINKFYNPNHLFEVIIMGTYILAQYLIFRSMVLEEKKTDI